MENGWIGAQSGARHRVPPSGGIFDIAAFRLKAELHALLIRGMRFMSRLKIGIIGAGYIGSLHATALARDERVEVVAVHDAISDRAEKLARTIGATVYMSADKLIEVSDAVYIATPNTEHTELALAGIRAGKHIFCEKPLATSLDDARLILEAASQREGVFQVGF